jgi:protein required for attachment to host cells
MASTWILVAHRGGARLFENKGPGKGITLLQDIPHPEGRLKNHDLNSDRHGGSADARGGGLNSYEVAQNPTDHVAGQFAKHLSTLLDEGRTKQQFQRLVLVAEPRFLGNLRHTLSTQTATLVTATVDKDLGQIEAREMGKHLEGVVYV